MAQVFLTVYDNKGRPVAAKTLVDAAGNDVINPRTGQPLVVPRDYDINAAIEFGRSLKIPRLPFNEDLIARELVRTYEGMYKAFQHGGPQELQRSYNGMVGGGSDEFVGAFKDAASFNLGVVGRAAGLSPDEIALGGGLFNWGNNRSNPKLDTSGPFFNNPDNFKMIQEGISGHDSGRFLERTPSNEQGGNDQIGGGPGNPPNGRQTAGQQPPGAQGQRQGSVAFGGGDLQPANSQLGGNGQTNAQQFAQTTAPGLPQHVIDAGNLLRANGYEITPRTMYVSHVLGPRAAIDLFKRTGSTSSDAVPSPDAATGDQMRAWARQLRLGPVAAAGIAGGMVPAANAGPPMPDQSNEDPLGPNQPFA
jgi:hypothetical protein